MDKEMSVNKEDGMASKKMAKGSISRGENSKPEQTKKNGNENNESCTMMVLGHIIKIEWFFFGFLENGEHLP